MKPTQSLLMVFLLPILMVVLPTLLLLTIAMNVLEKQSLKSHQLQSNDLDTLIQMAMFNHQLSDLHQNITNALIEAEQSQLTTAQRNTEYNRLTQELSQIGNSVATLAISPLIADLNKERATDFQQEFSQYQRFVSMANEAATLQQGDPAFFLEEAQSHFNQFTLFSQQIFEALTERASDRHSRSFHALVRSHDIALWLGLAMMAVLIGAAIFAAWRINKRLMVVGDAILSLSSANDHQYLPDFKAIAQLSSQHSGSMKHIASALMTFRQSEQQRREAEQKIHRLAYYDTLTDLPNWRLMKEHLQHSLEISQQTHCYGALIYIDVDDFKRINDGSGHSTGDTLLQLMAQRLKDMLHEGSSIGRLSGDEFGIIIDGLSDNKLEATEKAELFAQQVSHVLTQPYTLNGNHCFLNISQGVVLFNSSEKSADGLLQYANAAVHLAKKPSPAGIRFYAPAVQAELEARAELERELRLAIERDEFVLVYQMQVDSLGRPIGAEALIRWEHPERGCISPGVFIPLAEETGLIVAIGTWVLHAACEQLLAWQAFAHTQHLVLAVNVSAKQFQQPNFVEEVSNALELSGAPAHKLKLELTESMVLGKIEETIARMHRLKALGISFAMDDFGTGYSSLQYLKRLPLDQIKIDQSFVRELHQDTDDRAIVQTIIAMGRALSLDVIAEGVETQEHWRYLNQHQCHAYQGYYFCKPVSAKEMAGICLSPPPVMV